MPALGADMDEGTVLEWLVKPGDEVRKGDVIAVIDTDKSAIDVESFVTGTVEKIVTGVGQTVPVGTILATIAESAAQPTVLTPEQTAPVQPPVQARPERRRKRAAAEPGHPVVTISPLIRKRAHELGVDLDKLRGSGRGGAVTRADVERAAAEQPTVAPKPPTTAKPPTLVAPPATAEPPARAERRVRATPRARRVAAELGVDLAGLTGTGSAGAVTEADVRRAVPAREAVPAPEASPPSAEARGGGQPPAVAARSGAERALSMRQAIGRLMARSNREIPHYYVNNMSASSTQR